MLGKQIVPSEIDPKTLEEIRGLRRELAEVRGTRDAVKEELGLSKQIITLREEIEKLKIERARHDEDAARREREVEHKVGLERTRQEFEREQSKREAIVAVREENLEADRNRFEDQMKFTASRFEDEVGYLKEIMGEVLRRLPDITVTHRVGAAVGANGNGNEHDDEDAD